MKIFLTYNWTDAEQPANRMDDYFGKIGLELTRDVKDLPYKGDLSAFMGSIVDHEYAVAIIGDNYLRSENCMHEAINLLESGAFDAKILPLYIEGTPLFDANYALEIVKYWENKCAALDASIKGLNSLSNSKGTIERLEKYNRILSRIDELITRLCAMKIESVLHAESTGYKSILDHVKHSDTQALSEVLRVLGIGDHEEQLIALRRLGRRYPKLLEIDLIESRVHLELGEFRLATDILEQRLIELPNDYLLHINLGSTLAQGVHDFARAKQEYERAIDLKPDFGEAYYNLARLQYLHLNEIESARKNYEKAMVLRPNNQAIVNNYAVLLKNHPRAASDIESAKTLLENLFSAGGIEGVEPYLTYASLLDESLNKHDEAKEIMETARDLYPSDPDVYHHLGVHSMNVDKDVTAAELYFRKAVEIDPFNPRFNYSLGRLLLDRDHAVVRQSKDSEAEIFLRCSISVDPSFAPAQYALYLLFFRTGPRIEEAKEHYIAATNLDDRYIDPVMDRLYSIQRT